MRFHSQGRPRENKRQAQEERRRDFREKKLVRQDEENRRGTAVAFAGFIAFATEKKNESTVGPIVKKMGLGDARKGWWLVDRLKSRLHDLAGLAAAWRSIPATARIAIVEWSSALPKPPKSTFIDAVDRRHGAAGSSRGRVMDGTAALIAMQQRWNGQLEMLCLGRPSPSASKAKLDTNRSGIRTRSR